MPLPTLGPRASRPLSLGRSTGNKNAGETPAVPRVGRAVERPVVARPPPVGEDFMGANFGIAGLDWQQRVNWDRLRKYRTERAREMMKKHGLGAVLCMYDENVRYITGTLTPGWNRLKPGLRYAMLCADRDPRRFEQGDLGFQIERHSPWLPKENVRHSFAWIKGAAGPASTQQVTKFTNAIIEEMQRHGVAGEELRVGFLHVNMIGIFKGKNINWGDGIKARTEA